MKSFKKFLPISLILLVSILVWYSNLYKYFNFETLKMYQKSTEIFVDNNLILSILIYSILYILIVGFSLPIATFMTLLGGFFFGQWLGSSFTVLSATVGASILFLSAKMASEDFISKKAGGFLKKMQGGFKDNAFSYLLTLRLIPIFPFLIINLACAFFQIPLRTFFWATLIGIIPGTFIYVSMGVALKEVIQKEDFQANIILEPKIFLALIGLGLLSLFPIVYKYVNKKRAKR